MSQKIRQDVSIGSNIRKLRKKLKLTQGQVIAKLQLRGFNISRSIYSQIELGTYNKFWGALLMSSLKVFPKSLFS